MSDQHVLEPTILHQFKNHLAIISGYSELLLADFAENDPRYGDIFEIHKAARAAMALLPELARENY